MNNTDDRLILAPDGDEAVADTQPHKYWKLLIVDDEKEVHEVTRMALSDFEFRGRKLEFLSAYSGAEAKKLVAEHDDIALILLDVVMETDHAGLEVARFIRGDLQNSFVRIILRTGQPGQAPEHAVITQYDINDYKQKTDLTRHKLFTAVYTSISSYRDLIALDLNRRGLEKVIDASARLFDVESLARFTDGVLEQLTALLYLDQDALIVRASAMAAHHNDGVCEIVAATGQFKVCVGQSLFECVGPDVCTRIDDALQRHASVQSETYYAGFHQSADGHTHILYVSGEAPLAIPNCALIDLFVRNVSLAYEHVWMRETISKHGTEGKGVWDT